MAGGGGRGSCIAGDEWRLSAGEITNDLIG